MIRPLVYHKNQIKPEWRAEEGLSRSQAIYADHNLGRKNRLIYLLDEGFERADIEIVRKYEGLNGKGVDEIYAIVQRYYNLCLTRDQFSRITVEPFIEPDDIEGLVAYLDQHFVEIEQHSKGIEIKLHEDTMSSQEEV